jgi:excisionase family DNA binding protein
MKLSLKEAAAALGKTRRQLIYLIEQGRIPAQKVGARWYIESSDLELDSAAQQRLQGKQAHLQEAIEDALLPAKARKGFSLRDLKAFQIAHPLYQRLRSHPGEEHAATRHLHQCLACLAQGCHRYGRGEKTDAYQEARDAASLAVLELILCEDPAVAETIAALEQDLMAALAGLLRRVDRRGKSTL